MVVVLAGVQVVATVVVQAQGVTAHRSDLQAVVLHGVPIRNRGVQVAATAETVLQEQLLHATAPQHVRNRLQQIVPRRLTQRRLETALLRVANRGENRSVNSKRKTAV